MSFPESPWLCVLHFVLMLTGLGPACLSRNPARSQSTGWLIWGVYTAGVLAILLVARSTETDNGSYSDWSRFSWPEAVAMMTVAATGAGLWQGAARDRLFLMAGGCGVIAEFHGSLQFLFLLLLLVPARWFSSSGSLTTIVSAALTGLGILLSDLGSQNVEQFLTPVQKQQLSLILVLAGAGGLTGWFPFPVLTQYANNGPSSSGSPIDFLLKCLITSSIVFTVTRQMNSEGVLGILVIATAVPSILSGVRLLKAESAEDYNQLRCFVAMSSLMAPLCLMVWQQSGESAGLLESEPGFWSSGNLSDGLSLFTWGAIVEWSSLLFLLLVDLPQQKPSESADQSTEDAPGRSGKTWSGIALWVSSGLPPSPVFWWRFQLVASLAVAHRQSSLTRLVEPHPLFLLLIMLLTVSWTLTAAGALRLWLRDSQTG